jgi:hypothetical protein
MAVIEYVSGRTMSQHFLRIKMKIRQARWKIQGGEKFRFVVCVLTITVRRMHVIPPSADTEGRANM